MKQRVWEGEKGVCLAIEFPLCWTYYNSTRRYDLEGHCLYYSITVHTSTVYRARIIQPTKYVRSIILPSLYYYIMHPTLQSEAHGSIDIHYSCPSDVPSRGVL